MEMRDRWGWHALSLDQWLFVQGKLKDRESMTWQEILEDKQSHFVEKWKLDIAARRQLEERQLDDIDQVFSLRLGGTERVWGIRVGSVLRTLWWDPNHEICPSQKKHT